MTRFLASAVCLLATCLSWGCHSSRSAAPSAAVTPATSQLHHLLRAMEKRSGTLEGDASEIDSYLNASATLATLEGPHGPRAHYDRIMEVAQRLQRTAREREFSPLTVDIFRYHAAKHGLEWPIASGATPGKPNWLAAHDAAREVLHEMDIMEAIGAPLSPEWIMRRCVWLYREYEAQTHLGDPAAAREAYLSNLMRLRSSLLGHQFDPCVNSRAIVPEILLFIAPAPEPAR